MTWERPSDPPDRPFGVVRIASVPGIRFGPGASRDLGGVVAARGSRAALVVGQRSMPRERLAALHAELARHGVDIAVELRSTPEPDPEDIDALAAQVRSARATVVLGVGGGSTLDTAKAVAGLAPGTSSVMDHLEGVGRGVPYRGPALPWVAVPTTAGTGSEVTRNAVLTRRGPAGFKRSFRDDRLIATDAVVDPDLLAGAPPSLIASNGLDALTQLLEAATSAGASRFTDALAVDGLRSVRAGLLVWHADPEGVDAATARGQMAWAALLSGLCLANAGLGAVHGLAAPVGALLSIPHGTACGALLTATVRLNIRALEDRDAGAPGLARYAAAGRVLCDLGPRATDAEARAALVGLLGTWTRRLEMPSLVDLGLGASDVSHVLAGVSSSSMRTNPVALSDAELRAILLDRPA